MTDTPINDLHSYISVLLERGEMLVVAREVDPRYELAAGVANQEW